MSNDNADTSGDSEFGRETRLDGDAASKNASQVSVPGKVTVAGVETVAMMGEQHDQAVQALTVLINAWTDSRI